MVDEACRQRDIDRKIGDVAEVHRWARYCVIAEAWIHRLQLRQTSIAARVHAESRPPWPHEIAALKDTKRQLHEQRRELESYRDTLEEVLRRLGSNVSRDYAHVPGVARR